MGGGLLHGGGDTDSILLARRAPRGQRVARALPRRPDPHPRLRRRRMGPPAPPNRPRRGGVAAIGGTRMGMGMGIADMNCARLRRPAASPGGQRRLRAASDAPPAPSVRASRRRPPRGQRREHCHSAPGVWADGSAAGALWVKGIGIVGRRNRHEGARRIADPAAAGSDVADPSAVSDVSAAAAGGRRADAAATPHAHRRAHRTRAPITAPIAHDAGDSRAPVRRQPRPRHAKRA
jgi:hypothetical protein